jgi:hypothetical protein
MGRHWLVQQAFNIRLKPEDLSEKEVNFHLKLCSIFHGITRTNQAKLTGVLSDLIPALLERPAMPTIQPTNFLENVMIQLRSSKSFSIEQLATTRGVVLGEINETIARMKSTENVFKHTAVPTTLAEVQKLYLTGVNSIVENLPCPEAIMTPDGCHSYLPLTELLSTYLAHGYNKFERIPRKNMDGKTTNSYYQSPHYESIREAMDERVQKRGMHFLPLLIAIKDWSDDFDKNNSARNRHSIWMKTVTVLMDSGNGSISYNSFVIAIGSKGDSHEDVEQLYTNDLKKIIEPNEYFFGASNRNIVASVYLAASIQDRPERDSANGTLGHSSTFCKRFQYCCFINKVSPIPSCHECFDNRIARLQNKDTVVIRCDVCTDWSMSPDQTLLHKKLSDFPSSFKWPQSEAKECPNAPAGRAAGKRDMVVFVPVQMNYDWMIQVVRYCFFNYHTRLLLDRNHQLRRTLDKSYWGWNKGESENFLRVCGLSKAITERIMNLATECLAITTEEALPLVEANIVPALWRRPLVQLHQHHDAIFHMVFHGILPDVVQLVSNTLKKIEIRGEVVVLMRWLIPLLRDYHLIDLPLLPFSKGKNGEPFSMGAWVGSQKVAFSRVITYSFCQCGNISRKKFVVGVRHVDKLAKALHFTDLMTKMLRSYNALVARVMSRYKTPSLILEVEEYVKLFLSCFLHLENACEERWTTDPPIESNSDSIDGPVTGAGRKKKPKAKEKERKYTSTGNHLSMLNIPSTINKFGTLRDFWDGNDEKLVQKLKPRCQTMRKLGTQTWKRTVLNHVTRSQSIDIITGYNDHDTKEDGMSKFVYSTSSVIMQNHADGHPLLITKIRGNTGKLFCLYKSDGGMIGQIEMSPIKETSLEVGGAVHVAISMTMTDEQFAEVTCFEQILATGMILPMRTETETETGTSRQKFWHIFDFDWNVYEKDVVVWPGVWK